MPPIGVAFFVNLNMFKTIQEINLKNALVVLNAIPEFNGTFTKQSLELRLTNDPVILIALDNETPVGCKIGYNRFFDESFYSWLGGVIPTHRKLNIATDLNSRMELISRQKGYTSITFKTQNKFKAMLQFGLKNNYEIVGFEKKDAVSDHRIILSKPL